MAEMPLSERRFWQERQYMVVEALVSAGGYVGIDLRAYQDRVQRITEEHRFPMSDTRWAPEDRLVRSVVAHEALRQLLAERRWPTACEVNPW